jgi:hypothetical protein
MALEAKRSRYVAVAIARATWRVLGAVMGIQSARQAASAYPGVVLLAQRGYRFGQAVGHSATVTPTRSLRLRYPVVVSQMPHKPHRHHKFHEPTIAMRS